jgi:pyruvate dehydrogenase E2 component (dihydrolipoamide acetyltransferase)
MALEFRFPDVGEGIAEGEVVRWLVRPGDTIRADQPLVEIETDKAVVEIPAPRPGRVVRLMVQEGEKIQVGQVLVVIGEGDEHVPEQEALEPPPTPSSVSVVGSLEATSAELPPPEAEPATPAATHPGRILAIPSVRKLARELGVALARVTPTGPRGRIRREDVLRAAEQPEAPVGPGEPEAAAAVEQERDDFGPTEWLQLPALRRTMAEAMVRAANTAVPVTTTDEVDATKLVTLWQRSRDTAGAQGGRLTMLPFVMKAVVAALSQHPQLNATLTDDQRHLVLKRYYHLGIATDTPDGLIVPVVKDVDRKSVLELAAELQRLTELARARRIALADLRGGTFTISNYGAIGGMFATPMLHLPQVAILGMGKRVQKPMVYNGTVAVRTVLPLSLTFDHRALDGATAQRFLNHLMTYLADPARLLVVL